MIVYIEFYKNFSELRLPIIRLTKSKNKLTGTATFTFIKPIIFEEISKNYEALKNVSLIWENNKIISNDIKIFFYKGKPFLLKTIFLFKNPKDWFKFLNFMQYFSKETGLSFSEI
jgi:photosystem II protein